MGWEIYPQGLADMMDRINTEYSFPSLVVTENGAAYPDVVVDGGVADPERIAYLDVHIAVVEEAAARGIPVSGYFVWSLLDNLEWASGYGKRFGLVHVDFETQQRTIKDSGHWYRERIAASGL